MRANTKNNLPRNLIRFRKPNQIDLLARQLRAATHDFDIARIAEQTVAFLGSQFIDDANKEGKGRKYRLVGDYQTIERTVRQKF